MTYHASALQTKCDIRDHAFFNEMSAFGNIHTLKRIWVTIIQTPPIHYSTIPHKKLEKLIEFIPIRIRHLRIRSVFYSCAYRTDLLYFSVLFNHNFMVQHGLFSHFTSSKQATTLKWKPVLNVRNHVDFLLFSLSLSCPTSQIYIGICAYEWKQITWNTCIWQYLVRQNVTPIAKLYLYSNAILWHKRSVCIRLYSMEKRK